MIHNQKKVIQFALPAVIIIWGFVAFELFYYTNKEKSPTQHLAIQTYKSPDIKKKETFELLPTESDPFLGKLYQKKSKPIIKQSRKSEKPPTKWPIITYHGVVSDNNSSSKIFVISINGEQSLMEKGDEIHGIKIVKSSEDSISLTFKGEVQQFPLQ